jgi:hypothetical protein
MRATPPGWVKVQVRGLFMTPAVFCEKKPRIESMRACAGSEGW